MAIESLTKENFWNDLQAKYPKAMKEFCEYIDQYKAKNAWPLLFSGDQIKFHHLPIDMQLGVIVWYIESIEGETFNREQYLLYMRSRISDFFIDREKDIDNG